MASFTARELEILALVHQCFISDPKVCHSPSPSPLSFPFSPSLSYGAPLSPSSTYSPEQVDYEKLAALGGFKNKASASAVWGAIRKKVSTHATNGAASTATATAAASSTTNAAAAGTSTKRKKPTKATTDDSEGASPPKRGRPAAKATGAAPKGANGKGGKAKGAVKKEPSADEMEEEQALLREEEAEMVRAEERELIGNLAKKEAEIEGEEGGEEIHWEAMGELKSE